ncbi:MAG: hypothetical protein ACE5NG_18980, partial [bacterium]
MKKILSLAIIFLVVLLLLYPMRVKSAQRPDWIPSDWIQLTVNSYYDAQPSWSPDGSEIVYTAQAQAGSPSKMWVMNADGANKKILRDLWIEATDISPDGSKIVFSRYAGENRFHIAMTDFTEDDIYDFTDIYSINSSHVPQWSPKGDKIAFHSETPGATHTSRIFTINPDGTEPMPLTTEDCFFPSWSPDGSKIAYQKGWASQAEICVMNADGSNMVQLTNMLGDLRAVRPMWSPDGKISFLSDFEGQVDIYMMNEDGTNIVRLTNTPGTWNTFGEEYDHVWSPDGKWIALSEHIDVDDSDIYLMPMRVIKSLSASMNIDPNTLNLKSNGEWITAYIELPEGYDVADIDIFTVQLEGIPAITDT